ncbi:hypothetical protein QFC21_006255 [Naganishia friedmannii]|uniref:Uncharacterized protein n=1 Tax=Naganishia friedmannii TaxID=89922 RepID=A0ACC2V4E8_9TREE|nr:hypothetical protein QFC21_006255 [Naganishia friedmannii]
MSLFTAQSGHFVPAIPLKIDHSTVPAGKLCGPGGRGPMNKGVMLIDDVAPHSHRKSKSRRLSKQELQDNSVFVYGCHGIERYWTIWSTLRRKGKEGRVSVAVEIRPVRLKTEKGKTPEVLFGHRHSTHLKRHVTPVPRFNFTTASRSEQSFEIAFFVANGFKDFTRKLSLNSVEIEDLKRIANTICEPTWKEFLKLRQGS